jgi:undecaprenyl-diphosphatase
VRAKRWIAGNAAGLTAEKAAEFSFLLGTPIILAAGVLEQPKLLWTPYSRSTSGLTELA